MTHETYELRWDEDGNPVCPKCGGQEFIATIKSEESETLKVKDGKLERCDIGGDAERVLECDSCDCFLEVGDREIEYFWVD